MGNISETSPSGQVIYPLQPPERSGMKEWVVTKYIRKLIRPLSVSLIAFTVANYNDAIFPELSTGISFDSMLISTARP